MKSEHPDETVFTAREIPDESVPAAAAPLPQARIKEVQPMGTALQCFHTAWGVNTAGR